MGQFVCVQGRDPAAVRGVFEGALAVFQSLYGIVPEALAEGETLRVAKFARTAVPGTGLVRDDTTHEFGLSAGTWVSAEGGASGAALRRLTRALLDDGTQLAQAGRGLDGGFVLAAGSTSSGDVAFLTDRVGVLHAYHARAAGCAVVSTSALVAAAAAGAELDPVAVREMLAAHSVFEERSLWRGVTKLPAASVVRLRDGEAVSTRRWWSLADACWDRTPHAAGIPELAESLVEAVEALLVAYPRACFDLTGGYDSRNLVAAALRTGLPFATVVNGRPDDANVVAANRIAAAFSLDHRNQVPGRDFRMPEMDDFRRACVLGDGETNVFDYAPTLLAHEALARTSDLAVNGSFGEVCRGYWWDVLGVGLRSRSRFDARRVAVARFATDAWADRMLGANDGTTLADHFTGVVERSVSDLAGMPDTARMDAVYLRVRMQRWHGRIASLVARVRPTAAPFASRRPLELALSMRRRTRVGGRVAGRIVEHLDPALAAMPLEHGSPATPLRLTNLHRHGPWLAHWIARAGRAARRRLRLPAPREKAPPTWRAGDVWRLPEMADLLDVPRMVTRDLYDAAALTRLVETCRAERSAPASTLGRVATLELAARAAAAARAAVPVRG